MTDTKNNSKDNTILIIFGLSVVAMFFAYLIYSSKQNQIQPLSQLQQLQQNQLQQLQQLQYQPQNISLTSIDNLRLQELQLQTKQLSDIVKTQNTQLQSLQEYQFKQLNKITELESKQNIHDILINKQLQSFQQPEIQKLSREDEERYIYNKFNIM